MCLNSFTSEENLIDHKTYCCEHKCAKILMPELDKSVLKFKHFNHSLKVPFVIYADFEGMLEKIHTCAPSDEESYTKPYQKHTPINFAYYIKYCNGDFQPPVDYSGTDAAQIFYEKMKEDALNITRKYYDKVIPMAPLTEDEKLLFETEQVCHICENSFDDLSEKVADHDHLTGKF